MFSTTRHVSRSTEPGFKYFSEGPLISALASVHEGGIQKKRADEKKWLIYGKEKFRVWNLKLD
jgi:hypothetical protein